MRLGEFLEKTAFCPCCNSSLALASNDSRLASDELHRSPHRVLFPASRVAPCCSP